MPEVSINAPKKAIDNDYYTANWSAVEALRVVELSCAGATIKSGRLKNRKIESISIDEADESILLDEDLELEDRHYLLSVSVGRASTFLEEKGEAHIPIPRLSFSLDVADACHDNVSKEVDGASVSLHPSQREFHVSYKSHPFSFEFSRGEIIIRSPSAKQEDFNPLIKLCEKYCEKLKKNLDSTDDEADDDGH